MHKVNISKIFTANIQILLNLFEGKKIYMVGGCVRDVILGKSPKDIDFCTNLTPDEIIALIPKSSNINIIEVGKSFGVIKLIINNEEFEIATFRKDSYRNSNIQDFIEYIRKTKPYNYEERINLLLNMSKDKSS